MLRFRRQPISEGQLTPSPPLRYAADFKWAAALPGRRAFMDAADFSPRLPPAASRKAAADFFAAAGRRRREAA